jgi:hypothetical protein
MAELSVGAAVGEGFALIRRSPATVLIWGLAQVGLLAVVFAVLSPVYIAMFDAVRAGAAGADPQAIQQSMNPAVMQTQSLSYLVDLFEVAVASVMYCAAYRAVLHPDQSQFGYLRVGMSELYVGALLIGGYMAFFIGLLIIALVVGIIVGIFAVMHLVAVAILLGVAAAIAVVVAAFYLALRFSLIGPMIVDDGKFHFEDAWALTRGHVLQLLMVGLVLVLIVIAAEIVLGIVFVALGVGGLAALAGGLGNLPTFFQQPASAVFVRLSPLLVVAALIWIPVAGGMNAILLAPWARVYRELKPTDVSATFA